MTVACCPACNLPYALVGRAHRCMPRTAPVAEQVTHTASEQIPPHDEGRIRAALVGPSDAPILQGEIGSIVGITLNVRKRPKRDRAKYMRDYRARKKKSGSVA